MRVSPDAGILELLRADGTTIPVGEEGEGEVIGTSLIRRKQIFLRYRVGDVASWDPNPDERGLSMPILREMVGRLWTGREAHCSFSWHLHRSSWS